MLAIQPYVVSDTITAIVNGLYSVYSLLDRRKITVDVLWQYAQVATACVCLKWMGLISFLQRHRIPGLPRKPAKLDLELAIMGHCRQQEEDQHKRVSICHV